MTEEESKKVPLCCSSRLGLTVVGFFGFAILYAQRSNLSVALVCMVNNTAMKTAQSFEPRNLTKEGTRCPARESARQIDDGDFTWTKPQQGLLLGAFFWGYLVTQLPGGMLAERYGGKIVILIGMCVGTVASLLTPVAAKVSYVWVVVARVVMGLGQGVMYPSMHAVLANWAPHSERSILIGCAYAGAQIGNVIAMPVSGALCDSVGWESVFYLFGGLSGLWCIVWLIFASNTPAQHKRISEVERKYIEQSIHHMDSRRLSRTSKTPWLSIATSGPVWAIIVGQFCAGYGNYLVLTELPTYMNEVLRFDMKSNGIYSAFPYLAFFLVGNFATISADYMRHHYLSTRAVRNISMLIALWGQAIFLVATGYLSCDQTVLGVLFLTISSGLGGFRYASYLINHVDIAPRYAGTLMGISNSFGTVDGIIAPYIASAITTDQTVEQWRLVFWIAGAIMVFGAAFFVVFSAGEIQQWAFLPSKSGFFTLTYAEQEELEQEPLLDE